jgi:hypothetical protein
MTCEPAKNPAASIRVRLLSLTKSGSAPSSTAPRGSLQSRLRQGRTRKSSCPRVVGIGNEDRPLREEEHPRIQAFSASKNCAPPEKLHECPQTIVFCALSHVYSIS